MRQRLILRSPINNLKEFAVFAEEAAKLSEEFEVRLVVSHLAHKDYSALIWPDDPYIQFSYNQPGLFNLVVVEELKEFLDSKFVEENRTLMKEKLKILSSYGLKGAIFLREPVYMPEKVFECFPDWRGPRVDHPRRSRHPLFAPCFHNPCVQDIYRRAVRSLCTDFPDIDTWLSMTNDCGSGFCWSTNLYNGPNGPSCCRLQGAAPAVAAYHRTLIEGSGEAGVETISVLLGALSREDRLSARRLLPPNAYLMPDDGSSSRLMSLPSLTRLTMPIRHLSNPLEVIFFGAHSSEGEKPAVIFYDLGQPYEEDCNDSESNRLELALFKASRGSRNMDFRQALELTHDTLARFYTRESAPYLTEGYRWLYEVFSLQRLGDHFMGSLMGPLYAGVSRRGFTRPLVPFQEELTEDETSYYLPHVFNAQGVEGKRDMLDAAGTKFTGVLARGPEWRLRNGWFKGLSDRLESAATAFESSGIKRGETLAKAARLLSCIWCTCRNIIEFALLREQACEKASIPALEPGKHVGDLDRQRMYEVLRDEIDNIRKFLKIWGSEDPERIVSLASKKKDEDSFFLGPDLHEQLEKKIHIMISKWEDVERLYGPPNT